MENVVVDPMWYILFVGYFIGFGIFKYYAGKYGFAQKLIAQTEKTPAPGDKKPAAPAGGDKKPAAPGGGDKKPAPAQGGGDKKPQGGGGGGDKKGPPPPPKK